MDGGYGSYISQRPCNETCGEDGYQIQMRICDSPPPDLMGMDCPSGMMEQRTGNCSRVDCGSDKLFFYYFGDFLRFMLHFLINIKFVISIFSFLLDNCS